MFVILLSPLRSGKGVPPSTIFLTSVTPSVLDQSVFLRCGEQQEKIGIKGGKDTMMGLFPSTQKLMNTKYMPGILPLPSLVLSNRGSVWVTFYFLFLDNFRVPGVLQK